MGFNNQVWAKTGRNLYAKWNRTGFWAWPLVGNNQSGYQNLLARVGV